MRKTPPKLLIYGIDPTTWAKRFGIEPFTHPCDQCGTPLTTTIPFVQGSIRGLQAPQCPTCGNTATPYGIVRDPKHGDLFDNGGTLNE